MKFIRISIAVIALVLTMSATRAEDLIKIAIGQRGVFENCISELGQDRGFFKKYGLKLEILYTQGGGETLQAILSHSVDMGIVGTLQTMGAYAKGAPLRAIGATMRGAYEYWYVPAESPIKSFKDAAGKSVAFSNSGLVQQSDGSWAGAALRRRGQSSRDRQPGANFHPDHERTG